MLQALNCAPTWAALGTGAAAWRQGYHDGRMSMRTFGMAVAATSGPTNASRYLNQLQPQVALPDEAVQRLTRLYIMAFKEGIQDEESPPPLTEACMVIPLTALKVA